jgi:NAD(P)-dependent dehydrogenase (short-subunit alcohol dehydrogenase family)
MNFANYPSLTGRVVFVTGGASGIGADVVRAFAGNGAKVAFVDIQVDAGEALVAELGDAAKPPLFLPVDLADIDALRGAIDTTRRMLGPVAVLVNNAGNDDRHDVDTMTPEYWDRAMNVNLRHQFFAAQAVRPHMKELGYGSIINFSSIAWMSGAARMVAYTTAKSAVVGLTKTLGREFGADNIRVNAIAPGAVVTERQLRLWYSPEEADQMASRQAIKRRLLPMDIARTALFLAADDSEMITKQYLVVDGGMR